jgi:type II secretory pathway pseudopilin PulG
MNTSLGRKGAAGNTIKLSLALLSLLIGASCSSSEGLNSYTKAVGAADEGAAIQTLRTIASAQAQYRAANGEYGSFDALTKGGMLDVRFAADAPTLRGYRFTMNAKSETFTINADPQATESQPAIGSRHFFLDSSDGVIRANSKQPAGAGDPPQQ